MKFWLRASDMLKKIHIQDFRLCKSVSIEDAGPVVALVGRNGAGKSNILQAIHLTARMATTVGAIARPEPPSVRHQFSVNLEFEADGAEFLYGITTDARQTTTPVITEMLDRKTGESWQKIFRRLAGQVMIEDRPQPLMIGEFSATLPTLAALLPATDDVVSETRPAFTFLSSIRYYPLDEPMIPQQSVRNAGPVAHSQYSAWVANYESSGNIVDSVLMRIIHMNLKQPDDFELLKSLIGENGLGLIDSIDVVKHNVGKDSATGPAEENIYYFVYFGPSRGQNAPPIKVMFDALSLGTRRVLRMFANMIFDRSSVMLLEQPEDSLHQGMTKKVVGLLRSNSSPSQLIMSSHSSALLNKFKPEEIRLVALRNGFTEIRPLTPMELSAAIAFMNEEGPLYDFLESIQGND